MVNVRYWGRCEDWHNHTGTAVAATMGGMVLRVRGFALPEGGPVDLYAGGDRWTTGPVRAPKPWPTAGLPAAAAEQAARTRVGAPVDAVIFETDPRTDLSALDRPRQ